MKKTIPSSSNAIDKTYTSNMIFGMLKECTKFYESLSFSIFRFMTPGTTSYVNIDSYLFSSVQGTLDSIYDILLKGRISDAYALLRKYHDSIIINIYITLYAKNNLIKEDFLVKKINNWVNGIEQLPEYRIMSQYIRDQKDISEINDLFYKKDKIYSDLRDRCNDNTHYNFYYNVLLNDNEIYNKDRLIALNEFSEDFENLFILHLGYLFYINSHYMSSSDYIESLDMGIEPEEGSQYYVAPFIQKIFDDILKKKRSDVVNLIKKTTSMQLE